MKNLIRWTTPHFIAVFLLALLAANTAQANDAFGPGLIPTGLTVSAPSSVIRGKPATVSARLIRLDTGAPLRGQAINFYYGDPTYPGTRVGTRVVTDRNGVATLTFTPSIWGSKGPKVILAEYFGWGQYARPLPYARLTAN